MNKRQLIKDITAIKDLPEKEFQAKLKELLKKPPKVPAFSSELNRKIIQLYCEWFDSQFDVMPMIKFEIDIRNINKINRYFEDVYKKKDPNVIVNEDMILECWSWILNNHNKWSDFDKKSTTTITMIYSRLSNLISSIKNGQTTTDKYANIR